MSRAALSLILAMAFLAAAPYGLASAPEAGQAGLAASQNEDIQRILERPEYQRWKQRQILEKRLEKESYAAGLAKSFLKTIWEGIRAIFRWLGKLFERGADMLPGSPIETVTMVDVLKQGAWLAVALLLIVGGVYLYGARGRLGARIKLARTLSREKTRQALESGEALALDSQGWLLEAERMEAEGDLRAMYRAIYLALLSGLHDKGLIDFRKNRTNWVYVQKFKGAREGRETFSSLTALFDQVWYGQKPAAGVSLDEVKRSAGALLREKAV
ncbi:MAG: DUF4129 domain-containing protein [Nitrospinota bacterium]|nr:DUF4129 domain-containing protein [Nitrospinota bacterium]